MLDDSALPSLPDLDPEGAYLAWTVTLHSACEETAIREVFEFVEDDCVLEISAEASAEAVDEGFDLGEGFEFEIFAPGGEGVDFEIYAPDDGRGRRLWKRCTSNRPRRGRSRRWRRRRSPVRRWGRRFASIWIASTV